MLSRVIPSPTNLVLTADYNEGKDKWSIHLSWIDNSSDEDGFKIARKKGEKHGMKIMLQSALISLLIQMTKAGQGLLRTLYFTTRFARIKVVISPLIRRRRAQPLRL